MHESQVTAIAILIAFILFAMGLMGFFTYYERCIHSHGLLMMAGTAIVGIGTSMFRLLRGHRTTIVKYIHMTIMFIAVGFLAWGWIIMMNIKKSDHVHSFVGKIVLCLVATQIVLGVFLFTYLYEYRTLRLNYAPIHDVFGIFLFLSLVGCIYSGHHGVNPVEIRYEWKAKVFNTAALIGYMLIVIVVISPYFEWEIVRNR